MKITRRQLRKIISEAVKYVTVPNEEDEYFKDLRASQTQKEREAVQKVFKADPGMGLELGAVVPIEDETAERVFPINYDHLGFKPITDSSIWLHKGYEPSDTNAVINTIVKEFSRILKKSVTASNLLYSDSGVVAPFDVASTPREKIIRKKKFSKWWDMYHGFQFALNNPGRLKVINVPVTRYNKPKQEYFEDSISVTSYCCVDAESGMRNVKNIILQFEEMHVIFLEGGGVNAIVIHVP